MGLNREGQQAHQEIHNGWLIRGRRDRELVELVEAARAVVDAYSSFSWKTRLIGALQPFSDVETSAVQIKVEVEPDWEKVVEGFDEDRCMLLLADTPWVGNVRLKRYHIDVLHRAVLEHIKSGHIKPEDLEAE